MTRHRTALLAAVLFVPIILVSCASRSPRSGGDLPGLPELPDLPPSTRNVLVAVYDADNITVLGQAVPMKSLQAYLVAISRTIGIGGLRVIVSATEDTPYGAIARTIALLILVRSSMV